MQPEEDGPPRRGCPGRHGGQQECENAQKCSERGEYVAHGADALVALGRVQERQEAFTLGFDLQSTAGIRRVELVSRGEVVRTKNFEGEGNQEVHVEFPLTADAAIWYALVVRDRADRNAYTNPIWVDVDESR